MSTFTAPEAARLRRLLVERDGPGCQWCGAEESVYGPDRRRTDLCIDHKLPTSRGGGDELANLQLLCFPCNCRKNDEAPEQTDKIVRFSSSVWQHGFTQVPNDVLTCRGLSPGARLTYGLLQYFAWREKDPGQNELGELLEVGERQFRRYVRELEDAGLIYTQQRGKGLTNVYRVLEPKPTKLARAKRDRTPMSERPGSGDRTPMSDRNGHESPAGPDAEVRSSNQDVREVEDPPHKGSPQGERWQAALDSLNGDLSEGARAIYLDPCRLLSVEDGVATIEAPQHVATWVRDRFGLQLAEALEVDRVVIPAADEWAERQAAEQEARRLRKRPRRRSW